MKLQTRIILLLSVVLVMILIANVVFWTIDAKRTRHLIESKKNEKQELLNRSVALLEKSIQLFAYDYSYWDEMLMFSRQPDSEWAYVNLESTMSNFNVQAVWVFNAQDELIYAFQKVNDTTLASFPLKGQAFQYIKQQKYFCNFFTLTSSGLMEVFGAPIQPSSDIHRLTPPQGAFFVGRIWSPQFLKQLEEINNSHIKVSRDSIDFNTSDPSMIRSVFQARGWDGQTIAYIHSEFSYQTILEIQRLSRYQLWLLFGYGVILFFALLYFLRRWVIMPIRIMMKALNTNRPQPLLVEKNNALEFLQLSELINNFFIQKADLENIVRSRRSMEEALIQSEQDYRSLFDNAHDAMIVVDYDSLEILLVNAGACSFYVQSKNELTGKSYVNLWADRNALDQMLSELNRHPVCTGFEATHINGSGHSIQVEINACLVHYRKRPAVLCINRDIGERRNLQALQLSHAVLKRIRNIVLVANDEGRIIYANHSVKDILGYEPAEVLGDGWWNLTRPDRETREKEKEAIREVARGKMPVNERPYERWLRDRWNTMRCIVWVDALTSNRLVVGVGYDITERLMTQKALQESEQRYRFLFDHIPMALMMYSKTTGAILTVNQTATELFGYSSNQLLSMKLTDLIPSLDDNREMQPEDSNKTCLILHRRKDGTVLQMEIAIYDVSASNKPFGLVIGTDISLKLKSQDSDALLKTQKNKLSGIIEALEEERRRMASELHDSLGQLLSVVKRNLEIIGTRNLSEPEFSQMVTATTHIIDTAIAETKTIAYDLLPRTLQDFGLWTAVENLIQQLFRGTNVKVNYRVHGIDERLPYSSELALYRIVQEALNNILKHANASEVSVQFVGYPNTIILTIEDNGKGFDLNDALSTSTNASGMGLKSIHDRVAYLDGNVYIDSAPDKGTSIIIETPKPQVTHEQDNHPPR